MTDINMTDLFAQAGIDRRTGKPCREGIGGNLKATIKAQLRIIDEQDAVRRYIWHGLPRGLSGELVERILYYRGQLALFWLESAESFFALPYALNGGIDVYGRFMGITPVPMGSTNVRENVNPWIKGLTLTPIYDIYDGDDDGDFDLMTSGCVLLCDYVPQISQTVLPRAQLNDQILDVMAECIPFLRTALRNSTGIEGMRVSSQDESSNVDAAALSVQRAALNGDKWIPIVGKVDFQPLTGSAPGRVEEYLLAMQGLDNYRLSTYGMSNGGLFQKKSHMLEAEQRVNGANDGVVMQDGLQMRQRAADIFNSVWGTSIVVEINDTIGTSILNTFGLPAGEMGGDQNALR